MPRCFCKGCKSKTLELHQLGLLFLSPAMCLCQEVLESYGHLGICLRIWVRVTFSMSIVGYIESFQLISCRVKLLPTVLVWKWLPGIFQLSLLLTYLALQHEGVRPGVISQEHAQHQKEVSEWTELEAACGMLF